MTSREKCEIKNKTQRDLKKAKKKFFLYEKKNVKEYIIIIIIVIIKIFNSPTFHRHFYDIKKTMEKKKKRRGR